MGQFETIPVGDGTARLYIAEGAGPPKPGVVVLRAWWGLNEDVQRYADRLGGAGFSVVAPDMFDGQVADTVEGAESGDLEPGGHGVP